MRVVPLLLFLASFSVQSIAQPDVVYQPLEWFSISSIIRISNRLSLLEEGQFRYVGNLEPQQFQYRTGLDVTINNSFSIMPFAYAYTWNHIYGKQPSQFKNNEHRIFQQVIYKHSIGRANVSHRARLEQRFLHVYENNNGEVVDKGYDQYMNRFRYRFHATLPFNKANTGLRSWLMVFYDEVFIDFGHAVSYKPPDQNRVFVGLGYHFDKNLSVQGGVLWQAMVKQGGTLQENNIGPQLQFFYNVDWRKTIQEP